VGPGFNPGCYQRLISRVADPNPDPVGSVAGSGKFSPDPDPNGTLAM